MWTKMTLINVSKDDQFIGTKAEKEVPSISLVMSYYSRKIISKEITSLTPLLERTKHSIMNSLINSILPIIRFTTGLEKL